MVNARICYLIVGIESKDDDNGVGGVGGVVVLGLVFVGGIIEGLFWLVVWVVFVWVEVVLPLFVVCLLVIIFDPPEELPPILLSELLKASRILSNELFGILNFDSTLFRSELGFNNC